MTEAKAPGKGEEAMKEWIVLIDNATGKIKRQVQPGEGSVRINDQKVVLVEKAHVEQLRSQLTVLRAPPTEFTMSHFVSKEDLHEAMRVRIAELEAEIYIMDQHLMNRTEDVGNLSLEVERLRSEAKS